MSGMSQKTKRKHLKVKPSPAPPARPARLARIPEPLPLEAPVVPSAGVDRVEFARFSAAPRSPSIAPPAILRSGAEDAGRQHRQAQRRAYRRLMLVCGASLALVAASAAAGFAWGRSSSAVRQSVSATTIDPAIAEQKARALALMDEAVKAKFQERTGEALASIARAKSAYPGIMGTELLSAAIAVESDDADKASETTRLASDALARGEDEASARLLLAMGTWLQAGSGLSGRFDSRANALRRMEEAAGAGPWEPTTQFFWGEFLAFSGDTEASQAKWQGALHRLQPWHSHSMLALKSSLAASEASARSSSGTADRPGRGAQPSPEDFALALRCLTAAQARAMAADILVEQAQ
jgi:hypothetical protein